MAKQCVVCMVILLFLFITPASFAMIEPVIKYELFDKYNNINAIIINKYENASIINEEDRKEFGGIYLQQNPQSNTSENLNSLNIVYPSINYINIESDIVISGEILKIYAQPNESTYGTDFIAVEYLSPSTYYTKTAYLNYNTTSKLFENNLTINLDDEIGQWKVMRITIFDNQFNTKKYFNNEIYTVDDLYDSTNVLQDLSWLNFTVVNDEYFFDEGLKYYNNGEYLEALESFNKAIQYNSTVGIYYHYKGLCLYKLGKFVEALVEFNQSINLNPYDYSFNAKGNSLVKLNNYEEALEAYNNAISLNPNNSIYFSNQGLTLIFLNRYEEAIEAFERAIQLDPSNVNYNNKGYALYKSGRYEDALIIFDQSTEIEPNEFAFSGKGWVLIELERYEEAIQAYDNAIQFNPNEAVYYNNKAYSLIQLDRFSEALLDIEIGLGIDSSSESLYKNKGLALIGLEEYNLALRAFNKSLEIDPAYDKALKEKADLIKILEQFVSRAEFSKMIINKLEIPTYMPEESIFPDVPLDHWAAKYIYTAFQEGLILGYPDGTFWPDEVLSRFEYANKLYHIFNLPQFIPENPTYSDVASNIWAYEAVESVTNAGIMSGYQDGTFHGNEYISKIDAIDALNKIVTFGDISRDGKVNIEDIIILAQSYGLIESDDSFNSNCDLNNDGIIDILDLVILAKKN